MTRYRIGIDLGTTNSVIAYTDVGRERVVKVEKNEYTSGVLPSAVAWTKDGLIVGVRALRESECVRHFKREIGTDKTYDLGGGEHSPVELSSLVLRKLKEGFEREVGEIEGVVITVPANFTDRKRAETKEAGRLAGLDVLRIINEPSAAAIAYSRCDRPPGDNTLIVDWGGGTLDVSLIDCSNGVLDIKANDGDERCGGVDIDQALLELILDRHGAELGGQVDLPAVRWEVERAAEQIKIYLSEEQEWDEPLNLRSARTFLDVSITRKDLNLVAEPLVKRVLEAVDRCLEKAPEGALSPGDVSEVILVGGSSRLTLLQTHLAQKFGKEGRHDLNPMEVVALGAAYQAEHAERTGDLVTIHSVVHPLGTSTVGHDSQGVLRANIFSPIIDSGMKLPARAVKEYLTVHDDQEEVEIDVYEAHPAGELTEGMVQWGETESLKKLPKGPAGSFPINIEFEYSLGQELTVTVSIPNGMKREWVAKHVRDIERMHSGRKKKVDELVTRTIEPFRILVRSARKRSDQLDRIAGVALADLEAAVSSNDVEGARVAKGRLMDALFELGVSLDD